MQKVSVTGELRKLLEKEGFQIGFVFSDTLIRKGERTAAVKFSGIQISNDQESRIKTAMENLGFKFHYIRYTNRKFSYLSGKFHGTRFCFSKK